MNQSSDDVLLEVKNLEVSIQTAKGVIHAVKNATFSINKGEIIALVGESGSGKSVTAHSLTKLHKKNVKYGEHSVVNFKGENLLKCNDYEIRNYRGKDISMIFQDPMSSLNPVHRIGKQIMEMIFMTREISKKQAKDRTIELLEMVGLPDPENRINDYPHQLSGGMRQRVMIAIALASDPSLLIADEPTTALDVTTQAQILNLLQKLQQEMGTSILLITHDLGVVAEMANHVIVMYNGEIVEKTNVNSLFKSPKHPYTQGLIKTVPHITEDSSQRLVPIPGTAPGPFDQIGGCKFHPRCEFATEKCKINQPKLENINNGHMVSCWHPLNEQSSNKVGVAND